ncbi:monovalent cation/H+ antiporter complex subunit F [Microlunatus soli]|uniref:Multisubunit sodium/proton antiporter, MrpF subunit n=1 Tax=Microlunatus soli TaxID=630515 RepID=A0A1H1Y9V7_9ACTN|nr:monovalent cation/H+ antiporter complex subunit F [Microlunatus soli]SDT18039.1 multisubunit sodium/proton antiporter, MrpF subunit [Microlunatus soli]
MISLQLLHQIVAAIGIVALGTAALLAIIRIARGPSILDRAVATDVLIAVVIAGLVLEEVVNRHSSTLPVMLVLSVVGFAGAVSIARQVAAREGPRLEVKDDRRGDDS